MKLKDEDITKLTEEKARKAVTILTESSLTYIRKAYNSLLLVNKEFLNASNKATIRQIRYYLNEIEKIIKDILGEE